MAILAAVLAHIRSLFFPRLPRFGTCFAVTVPVWANVCVRWGEFVAMDAVRLARIPMRAVTEHIGHIFLVGSPSEIVQMVIRGVAIKVPRFVAPRGPGANEGREDEYVYEPLLPLSLLVEGQVEVPAVGVHDLLTNTFRDDPLGLFAPSVHEPGPPQHGLDAPVVADFVEAFVAGYRFPGFLGMLLHSPHAPS